MLIREWQFSDYDYNNDSDNDRDKEAMDLKPRAVYNT